MINSHNLDVIIKTALNRDKTKLSFDDVLIDPAYSETLPHEANLGSYFTQKIKVKTCIASAAMDTVTESKTAIAMAKEGGIGVIHKNLNAEQQAEEIAKVKNEIHGVIPKPKVVNPDDPVKHILFKIKKYDDRFHSFPVVNKLNELVGMVSKRDFSHCRNKEKELIRDIMSTTLKTAPSNTTIEQAYEILMTPIIIGENKIKLERLPLTNNKKELTGLYVLSDVLRNINIENNPEYSMYNIDKNGQLIVAAAIGVKDDDKKRLDLLVQEHVDVIIIDTAHGNSKGVISMLDYCKKTYPTQIIAGNIGNADAAKRACEHGANAVKVGIGPGSICTTRVVTGIGVPQLTAIADVAKIAQRYKVPVIADGGCSLSCDIAKCLAAGASDVMLGSMLAGVIEAPGEEFVYNNQTYKQYRGMGSLGAMKKNEGSRGRYNQQNVDEKKLVPEGVEAGKKVKGPLKDVLAQYTGGVKSSFGYVGAKNLKEYQKKAKFYRITNSGLQKSHPHNLDTMKSAPNYEKNINN